MKRLIVLAALSLTGCIGMTPATYMVSTDAKAALQKYQGSRIAVGEIANPPTFDAMCRAVGKVQFGDGLSPGQFVARGLADELKYAGLHSAGGVRLTRVAFSTSAGITGGWWDIGLTLRSTNGATMAVDHRYEFEAGFVGPAACNNASRAFGPAVQQLVYKTITDPRFAGLVR